MARRRQEEKEGPVVPAQDSGLGVGGKRMHEPLRKHEYFLDPCICSEALNQRTGVRETSGLPEKTLNLVFYTHDF